MFWNHKPGEHQHDWMDLSSDEDRKLKERVFLCKECGHQERRKRNPDGYGWLTEEQVAELKAAGVPIVPFPWWELDPPEILEEYESDSGKATAIVFDVPDFEPCVKYFCHGGPDEDLRPILYVGSNFSLDKLDEEFRKIEERLAEDEVRELEAQLNAQGDLPEAPDASSP